MTIQKASTGHVTSQALFDTVSYENESRNNGAILLGLGRDRRKQIK